MIQQDTTGMIWLGTDYGLSRYDGYEFINFTFDEPVSLNSVLAIVELNTDSLLVSFYREGVYIFNNGKLLPIRKDKNVSSYDNIVSFIKKDNEVYGVATSGNTFQYKNNTLSRLPTVYSEKSVYSTCVASSSDYGLLVGTIRGLYSFKNDTTTKLTFPALENRRIDFMQAKSDGSIWISSNEKVFRLYEGRVNLEWDVKEKCQHALIYVDYRKNIWRASPEQGLLLKSGNIVTNISKLLGIEGEIINCIEEDWEGNLWIGTRSNGVFCISMSEYTKTFSLPNKPKLIYSTAVLSTENYDWIASQGKLYKATNFKPKEVKSAFINRTSIINNLFQDKKGRILASTPLGVLVVDEKNNSQKIIESKVSGAIAFCYTNKNELLISSFKGLFILKNDQLIPYSETDLIENRINALLTDKSGYTWLGGEEGLYKIKNGVITTVKDNIKVFNLLLDKTNNIWAATNKGIFRFTENQETHYTTQEGLSHNLCNALAEDKEGRIWVGTLKGLSYFEREDNVFYPYDIQPFEEMDEILALSIMGDDLLVGTVNEAYKLKLKIPVCNPGIVISKTVIGDSIFYAPIPFKLPYKSNSFSVYFSSVAIAYGQQLRYEIKLSPIDKNWNITTNNNINYKNLPPGDYVFSVRVKNHANGEVSRTEQLKFSVFTPFWQKRWFIISIIIIVLIIAIAIHRIRLNIIRQRDLKKSKLEKQLIYLKMQAMNALMNPHFISNVLHSIISYLEHLKPGETVNDKYIAYFSELIRLNLINSDKSYIALKDELRRLELYILLEQFRFKDKFDFDISIDPDIDEANIEIPNMLVQPFVENAINHGLLPAKHNGKLSVNINSLSEDLIEIIITDNGIGINTSKKQKVGVTHRSMGIKLVKERMESSQQTRPILIEDISAFYDNKKGTRVTIILEV